MTAARIFSILWVAWIIAFCVIEGTAIATGRYQWTLSDVIWRLEEVHRSWTVMRYFVGAFCLFLFLHLTFGWLR